MIQKGWKAHAGGEAKQDRCEMLEGTDRMLKCREVNSRKMEEIARTC
jgi:hypothetical protein